LKTQLSIKERHLISNKEVQKKMQGTIDGQTLTKEANNQAIGYLKNTQESSELIIKELHVEMTQLKEDKLALTKFEEENKKITKQLLVKQKQYPATIDGQRMTEEANIQTMQGQRDELTQCKENISVLTMSKEANRGVIERLLENQKQCQATIDGQTKTVEANRQTIQELREKQKQLLDKIDNLTKTMEGIKPTSQLPCAQQEDVSTRKVEATRAIPKPTSDWLVKINALA
jgi:chromosome segregation ATPase